MFEEKTMLLTYIDENYEENLEFDFLKTLRDRANYQGKIVVINYGIEKKTVDRIKKEYSIEIIERSKDYAVFSQRYRDIPDVINVQNNKIQNILLIDGGDVWFQKSLDPIFALTQEKIGCIEEMAVMGTNEWTEKCLSNLSKKTQEEIKKYCTGYHIKNSGMIAGPRDKIVQLIKNVYNDICKEGIEYFGIDQLFFNYEFMKLKMKDRVILDNEYNFVLVTNKDGYEVVDDMVYRKSDGEKVTVVHNAGGAWRMLKRPFINKKINYDQYILEKVNQLNSDCS